MKQTQSIMGMHITIDIADTKVTEKDIKTIFDYFSYVDKTFSTYKTDSEISRFNRGELSESQLSLDVKEILRLAEDTKMETNGFFDIHTKNGIDPSGIVKGWAIQKASELLRKEGFKNFFVDAGGDIQVVGKNKKGKLWTVGIRNPFNTSEIIKVLAVDDKAVATSGTSVRGQHIYNPHDRNRKITDIVSITVIGPNIYEADRFATAAFAMGSKGIFFIQSLVGLEGYMINSTGIATFTTGFGRYVQNYDKSN